MYHTRRDILAGLAALGACAALPAWAQHEGAGHEGGKAPSARPPLGTGAALDAKGRLWVAQLESAVPSAGQPKAFNIILSWTADEGRSWTRVGPALSVPERVEANGEGRPKLAFGPAGQIYLSFTRALEKSHTGYIRFLRSLDGGRSFSAPVTVQRDLALTTHRFDSLVLDRDGRLFVAWIDKRDADAARAAGLDYRGAAVYYAVSADGGNSFGPDIRIADHSCECCRISLSLDAQGRVAAMWRHVFEPNVRDHAMAILPATGKPGPIERVSFDDWRIDACPHHGPSLAFDGAGKRHQVWFSGAADNSGLFYAPGGSGGAKPTPLRLGGPRAEHGEVFAAGRTVAVVWKEFDGKATAVTVRVSGDAGATWKERVMATSAGASDHPHLVGSESAVMLVWRTADEGVLVRRVAT